jgi:hypothetical protein
VHHRPAPRDGNRNRARPDTRLDAVKTAFSTSGWSRKGGTSRIGRRIALPGHLQALAERRPRG